MSLREDFRNALGSIAAAVPEAVRTMRHGEWEQGAVVQSSSRDFAEAVSATGPAEVARFVANSADFPSLAKGCTVRLADEWHMVTSCQIDPIAATFSFGLSESMSAVRVAYSRPGTRIRFSADALAAEGGETTEVLSDSPAIAASRTWYVAISAAQWYETTEPHVGDALTLCAATAKTRFNDVKLRVAAAEKRDGYWILTARTRGAQW